MKEAFTYCWTDHATGMLYVGYHKGAQNDGYVCSSKWVKEEYAKRPGDFTRQIIAEGIADDCHVLERRILKSVDAAHSREYYNQNNGDASFVCKHHTEATRRKIVIAQTGKRRSAIIKAKISGKNNPMYGKHHSTSTKLKISNATTGKHQHSDEWKMAASERMKGSNCGDKNPMFGRTGEKNPFFGKHHSPETRAVMKVKRATRVVKEETRTKLSAALSGKNNPFFGKHHTPETRAKISATKMRNKLTANNLV